MLFGQTHWNDQDDYPGWMPRSPITQLSFLAAFRVLGQEIENARLVTILWFLLLLLTAFWAISDSDTPGAVYLGLALIGTNLTLFAFSRLAIFEIPIALIVMISVLTLKKLPQHRPFLSLAALLLCLFVGAFGVKPSVLLYFLPLIGAVGLFYLVRLPKQSHRLGILTFSAFVLGGLLIFFNDSWMPRLDFDASRIVREFFASPIAWAHPLLAAATFLAVARGLYERLASLPLDTVSSRSRRSLRGGHTPPQPFPLQPSSILRSPSPGLHPSGSRFSSVGNGKHEGSSRRHPDIEGFERQCPISCARFDGPRYQSSSLGLDHPGAACSSLLCGSTPLYTGIPDGHPGCPSCSGDACTETATQEESLEHNCRGLVGSQPAGQCDRSFSGPIEPQSGTSQDLPRNRGAASPGSLDWRRLGTCLRDRDPAQGALHESGLQCAVEGQAGSTRVSAPE